MRSTSSTTAPECVQRARPATSADTGLDKDRHVFWRVFVDWQSTASPDDLAALSQALAPHAQHVRPIHRAVGDAVQDPATAHLLPANLLLRLEQAGW